MIRTNCLALALTLFAGVQAVAERIDGPLVSLSLDAEGGSIEALLQSKAMTSFAAGPYVWQATIDGIENDGLKGARVRLLDRRSLVVTGQLGPLEVEQRVSLLENAQGFTETISLRNPTERSVVIGDVRFGFSRRMDPATDPYRLVAVPYRRQADGSFHDYSMADVVAVIRGGGKINAMGNCPPVAPLVDEELRRLRSESWILTNGVNGLLVTKYNNEAVEHSAVSWIAGKNRLVFGGCAFVLHKEPVQANSLGPHGTFTFGETRYEFYKGSWPEGYAIYKAFLNGKGHGLVPEYKPQVQWNGLFDLGGGAWTYEAVLKQAAYARDVGCTRLYLDPGWEAPADDGSRTPIAGSVKWDEKRLGPLDAMVRLLRDEYGLELGLWTAARARFDSQWPKQYFRQVPVSILNAPKGRHRYNNLSLLPTATVAASSSLDADHGPKKVRDGRFGAGASWIPGSMPGWVEIDLQRPYVITHVRLSNDNTGEKTDRSATSFRILTATQHNADSRANTWHPVAEYSQYESGLTGQMEFSFAPISARWVRIEVREPASENVRIDEVEIYKADDGQDKSLLGDVAATPSGEKMQTVNELCMSDKEWLAERFRRLSRLVDDGVSFLMFDFHSWNGPCYAPDHGHPVPSTTLDHINAIYGLSRRLRLQHPNLRIEMHDAIWTWGSRYLPGYFRQGLRDGDYDENWGYEFMWNSIGDIRSGKAACLYYYNLGTDIPLYLHFNIFADNDQLVAFWWMASTIRHLGFGGRSNAAKLEPHGKLEEISPERADRRWEKYRVAMASYNRLKPYFAHGHFSGINGDESLHLHTLDGKPGGVLLVFNLRDKPVSRHIRVPLRQLNLETPSGIPALAGATGTIDGDDLVLTVALPPESPALIEIGPTIATSTRSQ
ncbi:MAG: discoidin domain-containing protein [Opitutaceae bacterium]|nr:discoidin domain-containing protein [Opitutaceae bacterium]